MSKIHGKDAVTTIGGDDLSIYGTQVEFGRSADSHDVTTFGKDAHVFQGGLKNGTATLTGIYDDTAATGPAAVLEPLIGTVAELIWQPEGTGTGKPTRTVDVLVTAYNETAPVADMITFVAELQLSDDVATTTQV